MDWFPELNMKGEGHWLQHLLLFSSCEGNVTGCFKYPDFFAMMVCPLNCESKEIFSFFSTLSVFFFFFLIIVTKSNQDNP